jgi:putative Holliday junction resolvase
MRIMGLDYGTVRIGVAISDPSCIIAQPKDYIDAEPRKKCLETIAEICRESQISQIVIGLPKHMNGDEGDSAKAARLLGTAIAEFTHVDVDYLDERLTTVSANHVLTERNMKAPAKKEKIDSVAAAIILQNYLDMKSI